MRFGVGPALKQGPSLLGRGVASDDSIATPPEGGEL